MTLTLLAKQVELSGAKRGKGPADIWEDEQAMRWVKGEIEEDEEMTARVRAKGHHYIWYQQQLQIQTEDGWKLVPAPGEREALIREVHTKLGHFGHERIVQLLKTGWWWEGIRRQVKKWVEDCEACQRSRANLTQAKAELQSLPIRGLGFRWSLDLAGELPLSRGGEQYIVLMMEHVSKWLEVRAIPSKSSRHVAAAFKEQLMCRFGACAEVLTDQGTEFQGEFKNLLEEAGITHKRTSRYHPQSDGLTERLVQTLKRGLRAYGEQRKRDWDEELHWIAAGYRGGTRDTPGEEQVREEETTRRRAGAVRSMVLRQPGPDGLCTTCFTPTASRTDEVERDLVAIQEAESAKAEPEGMTEMELAVTTHRIFGTGDEKLGMTKQERPTPMAETLRWILEEATIGTFDKKNQPRPYPRDVYRSIAKEWKDRDTPEELSVKKEEEKAKAERKEKMYQERIAAGWDEESARCGAWGDDDGTETTWGSATGASGTVRGWGTGGWGDSGGKSLDEGELTQEEMEEAEREMAAERPPPRVVVLLERRPRNLPSPPRSSYNWKDPWSEIEEGSIPATPLCDALGPISRPDPFARLIKGIKTPLNTIRDRNFLALYLTTTPAEGETAAEPEAEEQENGAEPGEEEGPVLLIPHETEAEAAEHHARYLHTSGNRAEEDL
ncbi:unnamed protein product [Closterium sp. NIES-54]